MLMIKFCMCLVVVVATRDVGLKNAQFNKGTDISLVEVRFQYHYLQKYLVFCAL